MKLEPELGFVGVKVPAQKSPFEGREEPIDQHLIVQFFTWLREKKNVREILKVVVRDDRNSPCSDEVIEESLREFNVRYLDWDREDLSSKVIEDTMEDVRGLSLYWSGNDAVLRGWADELTLQDGFRNGLLSLDQVRQISRAFEEEINTNFFLVVASGPSNSSTGPYDIFRCDLQYLSQSMAHY